MLWQRLQEVLQSKDIVSVGLNRDRPLLYVDTAQQLLSFVSQEQIPAQHYPVSTSKYGLGQKRDSNQTPLGIHKIAQKIGAQEPVGRVFQGREPTPDICLPEDYVGSGDFITTRILWLEGLQPGFNCGGEVDSHERYIYIHGTPDEDHIGQPASIGCVRMRNHDVMEVFERVQVGDLVIIE